MSESTPAARIALHLADGIATVELHNPAHRNAMTRAMCLELQRLMPQLDAHPEVTVVILRGAGSTFSAGAALGELSSVLLDDDGSGVAVDQLSRADQAIAALSKPTIAAVDGACMGGGWQIASACDFIVASERSVFAITPAKIGIIYPRPGVERLVRQVGHATAKYLLFGGEAIPAARAQTLGLVAEVVPSIEFDERCASLAAAIAERSRFSTHHLKRLVDRTAVDDPGIDEEWERAWAAMADNPDMTTGVEAFLRRETPRFTWRPERSAAAGPSRLARGEATNG